MPLETNVGATATYPLLDGVGSVTGTTNAAGGLTSFAYTAYGTPVGTSSGTYAYGTYGYDSATGLYCARARYYDPGSGRFLSEDPLASLDANPYVKGRPIDLADPSGQYAVGEYGVQLFALSTFVNVVGSAFQTIQWQREVGASTDDELGHWAFVFAGNEIVSLLGLAASGGIGVFVACALLAVTTALVWASLQGALSPESLQTESGQKRILITCLSVVPSFAGVPLPFSYVLPFLVDSA